MPHFHLRLMRVPPSVPALLLLVGLTVNAAPAHAEDPPAALLRVRPALDPAGPRITPYLTAQIDRAWAHDEARQQTFAALHTHEDVVRLQADLRRRALALIGGLPETRTPLNARVVGTVQRDGYRIEKVIFESLPGLHVTALVYVPDGPAGPKPAVLVACGHSPLGKAFVNYQQISARLAKRGYIVICWDPVGQGERSQFWDAAQARSRYNMICGEHAVLGNFALLAGTSLTRWMVWDGLRAVDYLLSRADVDPARLAITGTSGGGFQSLWIGALDPRIAVVAPSAFVTSLPTRMANRIFDDPDSDPEQDPFGLVSEGVDHAGLLLLAYPRGIHVSAAVKDFFPIEGTRKTMREVSAIYGRLGHGDRVVLKEGYHGHAYSEGNQRSAFAFLDRMLKGPDAAGAQEEALPAVTTLEPAALQCTRSGQVRVDLTDGRSLVDVIRQHYETQRATTRLDLSTLYRSTAHVPARTTAATTATTSTTATSAAATAAAATSAIVSTRVGRGEWEGVVIDRYVLQHGERDSHGSRLEIPLLHLHAAAPIANAQEARGAGASASAGSSSGSPRATQGDAEKQKSSARPRVLLSLDLDGHIGPADWDTVRRHLAAGFDVVSFDLRGTGEARMAYRVNSELPAPAPTDEAAIYAHPNGSVLANHVYNSVLLGRPYFLEALEDVEIVTRFVRQDLGAKEVVVSGRGNAGLLARAAASLFTLPQIPDTREPQGPSQAARATQEARQPAPALDWTTIVEQGRELWPIQYLMPGGAYIQLR